MSEPARAVRGLAVLACVGVLLSSCSSTVAGTAGPTAGGPLTQSVLNYGYGALPAGQVAYQPDVVVVGGGPAAIRAASSDGLTWTIDGAAAGAGDLAVGKVMMMTSQAVGRVVALRDDGDTRVVTLAPVDLPEVVSDASIDVDQDVDGSALVLQQIPDRPGAIGEPEPADSGVPLPPGTRGGADPGTGAGSGPGAVPDPDATPTPAPEAPPADTPSNFSRPAAYLAPAADAPPPGALPPAVKKSVTIPVGDWTINPSLSADDIGVGIEYAVGRGLKLGVGITVAATDLHIRGVDKIVGGQRVGSGFTVTGITGLQIDVAGGVANGSLDNSKVKIEVPAEVNLPIAPSPATGGLPLNIKFTFKILVETAFSGQNSTLLASGTYKLDGPIGIADGVVSVPTLTVEKSIIDSISGITLGPSGVVAAAGLKFMVGLGTPALTAGPFASLTTSVGVTNGSALGAALARCRSASLDLKGGGGAGIAISSSLVPVLKALLPAGTKLDIGIETSTPIVHREQTLPDVPLCKA